MTGLTDKENILRSVLGSLGNSLIAYSGGVDSAFLLWFAATTFPGKFQGILADSPSLKREELARAREFAARHRLPLRVIETRELENPEYAANPVNRCYFCKFELFERMNGLARAENFSAICYGENADDAGDYRPGQKAAEEFRVLAPLREAGLDKADIRALARNAGLAVAEKAAQPCLASRIPHGLEVTPEKLREVEQAEAVLEKAGFRIVRVRHFGRRALVQVGPDETERLKQINSDNSISDQLRHIGFEEIEFDPAGYSGASLR